MGMQLGDRNINIATMDVALRHDGAKALAVLTLDSAACRSDGPSGRSDSRSQTAEVDLEETGR